MTRVLPSLETLLAASLCLIATGYVFVFSGCSTIDEVVDLETARNEARYAPTEVAGTLALAVARAADYSAYSAVVHQSYSDGTPITTDGCIGIDRTDDLEIDGEGEVAYDFSTCGGQAGQVEVMQTIVIETMPDDDGWDESQADGDLVDEDGNGIPDEYETSEYDPETALRDMLSGSADVQVEYRQYREGLLEMDGSLALAGGLDGGTSEGGALNADMTVSALDYSASIAADGHWSVSPTDEDGRLMSFSGEFTSAAGLTWTVIASNIETVPGCFDALGGELTATYTNSLGSVEVRAVFDDVCDGCSTLFINGVDQGQSCMPDSPLLGTRSEEEV